MYLKNILKDKKGAALEMAIFFMMIIFCFCTLLTTMTLTARSRIKIEKAYLNIDINADKVVEGYLLYLDEFNQTVLINGAAWDTDKSSALISDTQLSNQCAMVNNGTQEFFQITSDADGVKFANFASTIEGNDLYSAYTVTKEEFQYSLDNPNSITCKVKLSKNGSPAFDIEVSLTREEVPPLIEGDPPTYKITKKIAKIKKSA